jgi:hypothetical protein
MKVHREKHSTYQCVDNTRYVCSVCSFGCGALPVKWKGIRYIQLFYGFIWIPDHEWNDENRDFTSVSILNLKLLVGFWCLNMNDFTESPWHWLTHYAVSVADIRFCPDVWGSMYLVGIMLTVNTTNVLTFNVLQFDLYSCYMFWSYKIIRKLCIGGIRIDIELPIWIHTSATCRIIY